MRLLPVALALSLASCGGGAPAGLPTELTVVVNAPFSAAPWVADAIERGTRLAAEEINADGGIETAGERYTLAVRTMDTGLSPQRAVENVRTAVADGVLAIVDEGTGVDASWEVARDADLPIGIVFQGGMGLVDHEARPNVFRIAPTDRGIAFRYAEYLVPKGLRIAFLHDDTGYGQEGAAALRRAFECCPEAVEEDLTIPADGDPAPQVLEAKRSGATALLVWARASTLVEVIRAARGGGWDVPIYAAQTGEDPLVRQQLADRPAWVDGLVFASGRMTAEVGPDPFLGFWGRYERRFGAEEVGVTTSAGETVVAPPSLAMYAYDFVRVLAAAVEAAQGPEPARVLEFLEQVDVKGANGDERGFNEKSHESVVDDDVYFAEYRDMVFVPVDDDPLSSTLDVIQQAR